MHCLDEPFAISLFLITFNCIGLNKRQPWLKDNPTPIKVAIDKFFALNYRYEVNVDCTM